MNRIVTIGAVTALGTSLLLAGSPAMANSADVARHGQCSKNSTWKLKAGPQNGRIEVEGEVDHAASGQTWHWRILHNGGVSAHGKATTGGASESFSVHRLVVNAQGNDRIGWRAHNPSTGETCKGGLTF